MILSPMHEMQTVESFAEFASLGVSKPDADRQPGAMLPHRPLSGVCTSPAASARRRRGRAESRGAVGVTSPVVRKRCSRRRYTTACRALGLRTTGLTKYAAGLGGEVTIVIKEGGTVQAGAGSELGQLMITRRRYADCRCRRH